MKNTVIIIDDQEHMDALMKKLEGMEVRWNRGDLPTKWNMWKSEHNHYLVIRNNSMMRGISKFNDAPKYGECEKIHSTEFLKPKTMENIIIVIDKPEHRKEVMNALKERGVTCTLDDDVDAAYFRVAGGDTHYGSLLSTADREYSKYPRISSTEFLGKQVKIEFPLSIKIDQPSHFKEVLQILERVYPKMKWHSGDNPTHYADHYTYVLYVEADKEEGRAIGYRSSSEPTAGYHIINSTEFINQNTSTMATKKIFVSSQHLSLLQALEAELKSRGLRCNALVSNENSDLIAISDKSFGRVGWGEGIITHHLPQQWDKLMTDVDKLCNKKLTFKFGGVSYHEEDGVIDFGEGKVNVDELVGLSKLFNYSILGYTLSLPSNAIVGFGCKKGTLEEMKDALNLLAEKYPEKFRK